MASFNVSTGDSGRNDSQTAAEAIQDLLDEWERQSVAGCKRDYPHALQTPWKALDRAEELIEN